MRKIEITEEAETELVEAVNYAREQAEEDSNDDEIGALQEALELALGMLGIEVPREGDLPREIDPDLHRKQLDEDPEVPC